MLWAAGSYTCFPLVFYCLTVRCSVGALGYLYFLFSFVSYLSPSMPCCAISEAVYCRVRWYIIGVVGACLPLVSTRFTFASQVCSCDFVHWDRRLYFATCLPLVYRFFLGPNISFTVSPTCLSFVVCFCSAVLKVENMICLPLNPTFLPLPSLCCGLWSPVCVPISLVISFLTCIWSHGRYQFGA